MDRVIKIGDSLLGNLFGHGDECVHVEIDASPAVPWEKVADITRWQENLAKIQERIKVFPGVHLVSGANGAVGVSMIVPTHTSCSELMRLRTVFVAISTEIVGA